LFRESVTDRELPTVTPAQKAMAGLEELTWTEHELHLDYEYWNAEEVLKQILPDGCEVPGSFETVGHIAHLNLRDELCEWRHVIGRVLLDKNPRLRTVVNKIGAISSEFRVPTWELLAGDTSLVTEVRQHGITFKVDFGEVYWNSRLEAEHKRLIACIKPGEVLCDVMAGIGPFAVPAAKAGIRVYASDLNPACTEYLRLNAAGNRVKNFIKCYNLDARAFIKALLRPGSGPTHDLETTTQDKKNVKQTALDAKGKPAKPPPVKWAVPSLGLDEGTPPPGATFDHVTMNLPASAIEFLDVFKGAFDKRVWGHRSLPTIHVYTFKKASETHADVVARGEGFLGGKIANPKVHEVRDVAPNKIMLCLSFKLTPEVAFAEETSPERKRARTGDAP
jgi:tRNA (guanine37-N1)-methyltransferase